MGVGEAELFKMMESGQLLSADVLPKVAKEMSKVANQGGALAEKYKTARVAQGRFFTQLELAQNTIFSNGMDEGVGAFFNDLAESLKGLEPMLRVIGRVFKVVFSVIGGAIRLVTVPFQILGAALDGLIMLFGDFADAIIFGIGSAVFLSKLAKITLAMKVLSGTFAVLAGKITAVVTALLLLEDIWMSAKDAEANTLINRLTGNVDEQGRAIKTDSRGVFGNMLEGYRQFNPVALISRAVTGQQQQPVTVNTTIAADSQGLIKVVDQRVERQYSFSEAVSN